MNSSDLQARMDAAFEQRGINRQGIRHATSTGGTISPTPSINVKGMSETEDPTFPVNSSETTYQYEVFLPRDSLESSLTATGKTLTQVLSVGSQWQISEDKFGTAWVSVTVAEEPIYGAVGWMVRLETAGI